MSVSETPRHILESSIPELSQQAGSSSGTEVTEPCDRHCSKCVRVSNLLNTPPYIIWMKKPRQGWLNNLPKVTQLEIHLAEVPAWVGQVPSPPNMNSCSQHSMWEAGLPFPLCSLEHCLRLNASSHCPCPLGATSAFFNLGFCGLKLHSGRCTYLSECLCRDLITLHHTDAQVLPIGRPQMEQESEVIGDSM